MGPLALILALLAMAMATVDIKVVPLDMAENSFDDQYLKCSDSMTKSLPELQRSDFLKNSQFKDAWEKATEVLLNKNTPICPLTPEQAIALMAYTMKETELYATFNAAVRQAGSSSRKYQDEFHFKSLHFLLTRALQTLRRPNDCRDVFRGVKGIQFKVNEGDEVRFGQFASTSLRKSVAWDFGVDTMFKVHTCHGVDIHKFSKHPEEEEVLIPPFETFEVTAVSRKKSTMFIDLLSIETFSNYNCEWLKGGSLPRNSPPPLRASPGHHGNGSGQRNSLSHVDTKVTVVLEAGSARVRLELPGQPRTARTAETGQHLGAVGQFLPEAIGSGNVSATS